MAEIIKGSVEAYDSKTGVAWVCEYVAKASQAADRISEFYCTISRKGGINELSRYDTNCKIVFTPSTKSLSSSVLLDTGNRVRPSDSSYSSQGTGFFNEFEKESNAVVIHDLNTGAASFTISISAYIGQNGNNDNWEPNCNKTVVVHLPISGFCTTCTPPPELVVEPYVAPDGAIKLTWGGAYNGTDNPITGYDIYYKISEIGSRPNFSDYSGKIRVDTTLLYCEYSITSIKNVPRGHCIVFRIATVGKQGTYFGSDLSAPVTTRVNFRPEKPWLVSPSTKKISAKGGTVRFTLLQGADQDNNSHNLNWQNQKFKYAFSENGERTSCAEVVDINLTSETTIYFWQNDGVEDSEEYESITIFANTMPTLEVQANGLELSTINSLQNAAYIIKPLITLIPGNNGQNSNTYNYYINYSQDGKEWESKLIWENESSTTKTIEDVRSLGIFPNLREHGYYYYFSATRWDGLDQSEMASQSNKFYVSKAPALLGVYNSKDYSNIENLSSSFSKALSFVFERDTGYTSFRIHNNNTLLSTISLQSAEDALRGQWLDINLAGGKYKFIGEIGHAANNVYISNYEIHELNKVQNLEIKNIQFSREYQVYDANINYDFSIQNIFNVNYDELNEDKFKEYGLYSQNEKYFFANLKINNQLGTPLHMAIVERSASGLLTDSSTLYFSLSAQDLWQMLPKENIEKNKTYQGELIIGAQDVFGNTIQSSKIYNIIFGKIPELVNTQIKAGSQEVNNWFCLKEGMPLTISGKFRAYNDNPRIQVQINRIKNGIESGYVDFGDPLILKDYTSNLESESWVTHSNNDLAPGNPIVYEYNNLPIITIEELAELEYNVNFRIQIRTDADNSYHLITDKLYVNDIKVCGHSAHGAVTLNSVDYDSAAKFLKYSYTSSHIGAPIIDNSNYVLTLKLKMEYRGITTDSNFVSIYEQDIAPGDFQNNSQKIKGFSFIFPEGKDAIVCRLALIVTQTVKNNSESYTTEKIVYTNEQATYDALPTVSYRKNLIGINASDLSNPNLNNAVLVIGEHTSKNLVYFVSSEGIKTVDVKTGQIAGFILDGGSWD